MSKVLTEVSINHQRDYEFSSMIAKYIGARSCYFLRYE